MQDMITVTLTKAEALAVADRIRTLYHRPAQNTIDLADAAAGPGEVTMTETVNPLYCDWFCPCPACVAGPDDCKRCGGTGSIEEPADCRKCGGTGRHSGS